MIIVAGSANTDLVAQVSHHPEPGETLMASGYAVHQGGKGANQAVAAARLGALVRFAGAIGDDDFGEQILASLCDEGIDTRAVQKVAGSSGLALITVDKDGENRIIVISGAHRSLDDSEALRDIMNGATALLLQLEVPIRFVNAALSAGQAAGAEIILNAAPAVSLDDLDMAAVSWLLVNAGEAAYLAGESKAKTRDQTISQARQLTARFGLDVIVTLGAGGALWVLHDGSDGHVLGQDCKVVDTTGAGDTFAGAFAAARVEGRSIDAAVQFAVTAASLSVGRIGAREGMPNRAELDSLG